VTEGVGVAGLTAALTVQAGSAIAKWNLGGRERKSSKHSEEKSKE
jgi:hypothetical protein